MELCSYLQYMAGSRRFLVGAIGAAYTHVYVSEPWEAFAVPACKF